MYHAALLVLFAALATYRPHRSVWVVVALVSASVLAARLTYGHNDAELYVIRSTAALLGGLALCKIGTGLALYHALIYGLTLCAYWTLSIEVAAGTHIIIYNHFEAVIYGLIAGQLIGIFPTVWAGLTLWRTAGPTALGYNQGSKKV